MQSKHIGLGVALGVGIGAGLGVALQNIPIGVRWAQALGLRWAACSAGATATARNSRRGNPPCHSKIHTGKGCCSPLL